METTPTKLARSAGISKAYASQIINGRRVPSLRMALAIFRKTGIKFGPIADVPDDGIAALDRAA